MTEVRKQEHEDVADLPEGFKVTELGLLPEEWEVVRVGELVDSHKLWIQNGFAQGSHNQNGYGVPHLRPFNISADGSLDFSQIKYVTEPPCDSPYWLEPGDVLFNNTNSEELVGKTAYFSLDRKCVLSNHMTIIRALDPGSIDAYWLAKELYYLWHLGFFQTICRRHVNQTSISLVRLRGVAIPLPPLPEQRAVAHVLGTVQRTKEATERVIQATRELKKSLMRHLFTYGPVPFGEAERVPLKETEIGPVPKHWEVVRLGKVAFVKGGKRLPKGHKFSSRPTPYPYVRVTDFKDGSVDKANLKFLTSQDHEAIKQHTISSRDVYISIAGTIGLVGIIPPELDGANLTENAAKIVLQDYARLEQRFIAYFLSSKSGQQQISLHTTKTSQPKLALARIKEILLPLPPPREQRQITRILEAADNKLRAEEAKKQVLEALFKALLHHLMTGKVRVNGFPLPETREVAV